MYSEFIEKLTLDEYFKMLEYFDWYYQWSDDYEVWQRGDKNYSLIVTIAESRDNEFKNLFLDYKKHMFSGTDWSTEKFPKPIFSNYLVEKNEYPKTN